MGYTTHYVLRYDGFLVPRMGLPSSYTSYDLGGTVWVYQRLWRNSQIRLKQDQGKHVVYKWGYNYNHQKGWYNYKT